MGMVFVKKYWGGGPVFGEPGQQLEISGFVPALVGGGGNLPGGGTKKKKWGAGAERTDWGPHFSRGQIGRSNPGRFSKPRAPLDGDLDFF